MEQIRTMQFSKVALCHQIEQAAIAWRLRQVSFAVCTIYVMCLPVLCWRAFHERQKSNQVQEDVDDADMIMSLAPFGKYLSVSSE